MKKTFTLAFMAMALCAAFTSCSKDNDNVTPDPTPDPTPEEEPVPVVVPEDSSHLDLLVSVGGTTGMSSTGVTSTLIESVSFTDVADSSLTISFKDKGADITADINSESVIKGAYYYEAAPLSNTWYGKYQITNTGVNTITKYEMGEAAFQARKYACAWIADDEMFFIGSNVAAGNGMLPTVEGQNYIFWSKVKDNGTKLELEKEGILDLTTATSKFKEGGVTSFSTSGLVAYRKSDNMIIYCFTDKTTTDNPMYIAFIDASTMEIKNVYHETRVQEMTGTAFGELQQDKMFFDDDDNLYISCGTQIPNSEKNTQQYGSLIRVNKGATEADQTWVGGNTTDFGKFLTAEYIGNNKCILYVQDPKKAGLVDDNAIYTKTAWGQNNFNSYYYVYDLKTGDYTEIKYNGASLPASCGSFTDRAAYFNGKVYLGTSCDETVAPSRIYIYDVATGTVTAGAKIESGYYFDRVSVVANQ